MGRSLAAPLLDEDSFCHVNPITNLLARNGNARRLKRKLIA